MRREVQAFVVNCTFKDEGCQWKGEVRHLEVIRLKDKGTVNFQNTVYLKTAEVLVI